MWEDHLRSCSGENFDLSGLGEDREGQGEDGGKNDYQPNPHERSSDEIQNEDRHRGQEGRKYSSNAIADSHDLLILVLSEIGTDVSGFACL